MIYIQAEFSDIEESFNLATPLFPLPEADEKHPMIVIKNPENGLEILRITADGTVISPSLTEANIAAKVFFKHLETLIKQANDNRK